MTDSRLWNKYLDVTLLIHPDLRLLASKFGFFNIASRSGFDAGLACLAKFIGGEMDWSRSSLLSDPIY